MKKIMLVDDDLELHQVYKEILKTEGYKIIKALTAYDALKKLQNITPDLILLDVMLPGGLNGLDFLKILKGHDKFSDIPVIMLTNLDGTQKSAKALGCADYIIKVNISLDSLVAKIKKHL